MRKILIMGLPGSGKTTLAEKLADEVGQNFPVEWINADKIRQQYNDWDFSEDGRRRQMLRIRDMADQAVAKGMVAICDFVCPTQDLRYEFNPDLIVWMDTIKEGRFENTNQIFEAPDRDEYDFRITEYDSDRWSKTLADLVWILE